VHELGFEIGSNDIEDDSYRKNAWCPNELVIIMHLIALIFSQNFHWQ
jgi:hypothetical protein